MKPKEIIYIFIAALFVAGLMFYTYQISTENKGLRKSFDRIEKELEKQKENNQKAFDSLQISINQKDIELIKLKEEIPNLRNRIEIVNRRANENKAKIISVTNADTLALILTRRYQ
jgi:predicted  nucleic acid-binding Zn-ribbon protein